MHFISTSILRGVLSLTAALSVPSLSGTISYRSGAVDLPPAAVQVGGGVTDNQVAFAFDEKQGYTVGNHGIKLDFVVGTDLAVGDTVNVGMKGEHTLEPGTVLNSHMILSDQTGSDTLFYNGSIRFRSPVVGLILSKDKLQDSAPLGLADVAYLHHGLDAGYPDKITLLDLFTVGFDFRTLGKWDEVRVITASPVPEPAAIIAIAALGMVGSAVFLRRKRSA